MLHEGLRTLGEEDLSGSPGAGYISKDNICKVFAKNLIPSLGDVQVYVHPQVIGPKYKFIEYGFSCALAARPTMATLTFSVWPEWDFRWIGRHLDKLKLYPAAYEAAA